MPCEILKLKNSNYVSAWANTEFCPCPKHILCCHILKFILYLLAQFNERIDVDLTGLGVFAIRFGSILRQNPTDPNNKFYFSLVRFGLIIIE